jgi:hypothetical protein
LTGGCPTDEESEEEIKNTRAENGAATKLWLIQHGFDPQVVARLTDQQAIDAFDALLEGKDTFTSGGVTFKFVSSIVTTTFGLNGFKKPVASNKDLQKIIDKLYQDTDTMPGGTAGAVRNELATGKPTGGLWHSQKAQDTISELNNFLKNNQGLSSYDQNLAKTLIQDLSNALSGKP